MLVRYDKVYITSIDAFGNKKGYPNTVLSSGVVINYRKKEEYIRTRFAELSSEVFAIKGIVKTLEKCLLDNTPINLVIRTNEKNPEVFDRIEKVEFD